MGKEGLFSGQNSPASCGWFLQPRETSQTYSLFRNLSLCCVELQLKLCHCFLYAPFIPKDFYMHKSNHWIGKAPLIAYRCVPGLPA